MPAESGSGFSNSVPGWIASGVLGLTVGAAATVLGMHRYGYRLPQPASSEPTTQGVGTAGALPVSPAGGTPPAGGGGPPMMGMGGGFGGGGAGGGKRNLTALVGKLELLSRPNLHLHMELDAEQAKNIALRLEELDKAEKMTGEEAQSHLDVLEDLLTAEQKETLNLIGLPFGRGGGGGGRGAAGRPGGGRPPTTGGGPPAGGGPPMMGMGGGPPDENPFTQETNQKRLRDLLGRLSPGSSDPKSESP